MPATKLPPEWFLCVDAGGTSCKVAVASSLDSKVFAGTSGPCNVCVPLSFDGRCF